MPAPQQSTPDLRRRRLAFLAAAGVFSLGLSVPLAAAPALADPSCKTKPYSASAAADLLQVKLVDLRAVGLPIGPVADVTVSSTQSGFVPVGGVNSGAAAKYLDAKVLGNKLPVGVLDQVAYQQAPPPHATGVVKNALSVDLGAVKVGTGDLKAHATWGDNLRCGKAPGTAAESSAALLDAAVLPSGNKALVKLPNNLSSGTETGLANGNGVLGAQAIAKIGLADLRLFAGTEAEVKVQVLKPPTLTGFAGGSVAKSSVTYTNPLLKIKLPTGAEINLDSPSGHIDLAVPPSASAVAGASALASSAGVPLLSSVPLPDLLGSLSQTANGATAGSGSLLPGLPGLPGLPALPGIPALPGNLPLGNGAAAQSASASGPLVILRLSLGELAKKITKTSVEGSAASLRLQVLLLPNAGAAGIASRDLSSKALFELNLGVLSVCATAPSGYGNGGYPTPSHSTSTPPTDRTPPATTPPTASPSPVGGNGGGGSLPVTGASLALIVGGGAGLLVGGRLMMMMARRRFGG